MNKNNGDYTIRGSGGIIIRLDKQDRETDLAILELASTESTMTSLAGIRIGRYDLNEHRKRMLQRVQNPDDYAFFRHNSIEMIDLAYLSAKTGDEFALLRGKHEDVLVHGTRMTCHFSGELEDGLLSHKYRLVCHSHHGEESPVPSNEDRDTLRAIGQKRSHIISAMTGTVNKFTDDPI